VFSQRQGEYEYQIHALNAEITAVSGENTDYKKTLAKCKEEINTLERARDTFKQQFLELREVNKDLKS